PAVVTISLGLGVKRFVQKNALVRRLSSVETLGSVSVICTDKTGTLTKNEMMVTKLWVDNDIIDVTGNGYELVGSFSDNPARFLRLLEIGMLANNSKLEDGKIIGDPTEGALIVSAKKGGLDEHHLSQKYTRHAEIPFDSERKMMSSVYHQGAEGATKILFSKGAIESLLPRCTHILLNGKEIIFTDDKKNEILAIAEKFSTGALRVLAFAYGHGEEEQNLIFVGLQAMMDPPREEAKHAIEKCKEAGIRVVMITGDNLITAQAIGEQLGIHGKAMLGADFEKIENKAAIIDEIGIFARVNPAHKQIIVNLLQAEGNVVAMTGDGVNDAPALKMADIGVSMGIPGTDVAKQSSDMILIDDNFASIVNAVEEGRGIYDNIQKFVGYLLASNIGEILIVFVASLLGLPLPLLAIHLLLINLITDGLPAIALGIDPINPLVMKRKPRKSSEFILDRRMIANIGFLSCLMAAGVLAIFIQFYQLDLEIARTASLVLIVLMELVKIWVIRSQYGLSFFSNKWLIAAIAFSLCFVLLITYSPLYSFFELKPFGMEIWREIIGILSILALLGGVSNHFFFRKI
ncbi:MAG TPA: cation-translocating P-type ATPase, partial [Candidatus Absconditabacterales bacterium]|nr:cation-translocating P-type ATPase [Candidatus Absconditabacterales bacterium]